MIRQIWLRQASERFAILYVFEERGDSLGMHRHELAGEQHEVRCLAGRAQVMVQGGGRFELKALEDCPVPLLGMLHEVTALEPGTVTLHRYPLGMPHGYETLPASERSVVFASREATYPLRD